MEKLYEENAYLTKFTGCVESCQQSKKGWDVILNQTAFYPEGGGQPWDTGVLGGAHVLEVHEKEGRIIHLCDAPLEVGAEVEGEIDWARRFDHMQQHSGEHIVSGLTCGRFHCDNVGFHMGSDLVTIDFNAELTEEDVRQLEADANRYIWENHPIVITFPTPEELEKIDYRSKKALTGRVRITEFPGADCCACCGTHVSTSAQVGLVKLLSVQKFREGVRIEMVSGGRAVKYLSGVLEQNHKISNLLSSKVFETGAAVQRLLDENAALKSHVMTLEEQHFNAVAQEYAGKGDVLFFDTGLSPDGLRRLCDTVLQSCGGRCVCFSGDDEQGWKYAMGQQEGDLRALTKELNGALNGRGGGKPGFVQGSVKAVKSDIQAFFAQH